MKTDVANMKNKIEGMPEGETKGAMEGILESIQTLDDLVDYYRKLTSDQKEALPESTRAFFERS